MNAMPKTLATEDAITNGAGQRIYFRAWRPTSAPKAIVVICPGLLAHSGLYAWPAERLANLGYCVYAVDLRGRGLSEGERYFVETIDEYVDDVGTVIAMAKNRDTGLPTYLLGHSAGGVVACVYALTHPAMLNGLICESFAFEVPAPDAALALITLASRFFPRAPVLKLKAEDFSRDPVIVERLKGDALIDDEVQPAATVAALARANQRLKTSFPQISTPVLILHGSADKVTRPRGSQRFFDTTGSTDKTLKIYEGHVHDLLADFDKERVLADIGQWIEARRQGLAREA
ncbi:alpha/beta hydrolase [Caulobacter segnis]|uniref:alpha/beta hydrolase n=1 Tax=Caulobacter segnis TaxID=88688 RepID=UPI001CBC1465|nr:alpha/beta hydrolase [Caulobacter segnis]UAL10173.1 lysophospholipase [Caulobacter segnis]